MCITKLFYKPIFFVVFLPFFYSAAVWACCPPCEECDVCEDGDCIPKVCPEHYVCDNDKCVCAEECCKDSDCPDCYGCVNYSCVYKCSPSQVCCNGSCVPECKVVDGEDCTLPDGSCAAGCAIGGTDCSWMGNKIIYVGSDEKICSPRGCEDCVDDEKICYIVYSCRAANWPIPGLACEDVGGGIYTCMAFGVTCYYCVLDDDNPQYFHWVQNDTCS